MMHSFIGFNYNSRKGVRYKMFSTVILNDALLICGRIYFHKKKKSNNNNYNHPYRTSVNTICVRQN